MMATLLCAALFALLALSAPVRSGGYNNTLPPLKFTEDGRFQISIFEDLHFGENAWVSSTVL